MKLLRNKKGFTLMEIIVVLIIIAIMAAALIPSFVNFARNARANEYIAQARIGMSAAQAYATDAGARGTASDGVTDLTSAVLQAEINAALLAGIGDANFNKFALNLVGDIENVSGFSHVVVAAAEVIAGSTFESYRITGITYTVTDDQGWIVVIDDDANTSEFFRPRVDVGSEGSTRATILARP